MYHAFDSCFVVFYSMMHGLCSINKIHFGSQFFRFNKNGDFRTYFIRWTVFTIYKHAIIIGTLWIILKRQSIQQSSLAVS